MCFDSRQRLVIRGGPPVVKKAILSYMIDYEIPDQLAGALYFKPSSLLLCISSIRTLLPQGQTLQDCMRDSHVSDKGPRAGQNIRSDADIS